jgi:TPR repeat protein
MYEQGRGVGKDTNQAVKYYLEAAEQGHVPAQSALGNIYAESNRYPKAAIWYMKAAEGGSSQALYGLGRMYELGLGVGGDYRLALGYYLQAAKNGYAAAQLALSYMYQDGRGVPKDEAEAAYWSKEASASIAAIDEELASIDRERVRSPLSPPLD